MLKGKKRWFILLTFLFILLISIPSVYYISLYKNKSTSLSSNAIKNWSGNDFNSQSDDSDNTYYTYNYSKDKFNITENVLILYNSNANDSKEIAQYYANARGINKSRLCSLSLPTGTYTDKKYLYASRIKAIDCICNLLLTEKKPSPCNSSSIDEIAKVSKIDHLVFIKGIPPRFLAPDWTMGNQEPSFDFYLSYLLYKNDDLIKIIENEFPYPYENTETNLTYYYDGEELDRFDFQVKDSRSGYIRKLNLTFDNMLAYGRIEGMTKERTFSLIDRTLESETKGFDGNFLLAINSAYSSVGNNLPEVSFNYPFYRLLSSSFDSRCRSYLDTSTNQWSHEFCRLGATQGQIPGEENTNIDRAINAGIYLGNSYVGNGHSAFDGFNNMLNWRINSTECITLCKDMPTEVQKESCIESSTDYFKEINTKCVGANNLIGWQYRSYPVQYFGFFPAGWKTSMSGATAKTPPLTLEGDSYINQKFSDDKYLHFGSINQIENPVCNLTDGTTESCEEKIFVYLYKDLVFDEPITPGESRSINVTLRIRNPSNDGILSLSIRPYLTNNSYGSSKRKAISLSEESLEWKTVSNEIIITNNYDKNYSTLKFYILSSSNPPKRWIELDGVEVKDPTSGQDFITTGVGSFNLPQNQMHPGNWASSVIARLNGIAWWGSSSHYLSGGHSFSAPEYFSGAFFSGRTLGESLAFIGDGFAGIVYGDPLYRPSGVKIHMRGGTALFYNRDYIGRVTGYNFSKNTPSSISDLYINAFHGREEVNWTLDVCYINNISLCNNQNAWENLESGDHMVFNQPIKTRLLELVKGDYNHSFILKLRVLKPYDEYNDLVNYALFNYVHSEESLCKHLTCKKLLYYDGGDCNYLLLKSGLIDSTPDNECSNNYYYGVFHPTKNFYCAGIEKDNEEGLCVECTSDEECDDGNLSNGEEFCDIYDAQGGFGFCSFEINWTPNISSCEELQTMRFNLTANYQLLKDIDCSDTINWNLGRGFIPIGSEDNPFTGNLSGNGFEIKNLYVNNSQRKNGGLFGYSVSSTIENLTLRNVSIRVRENGGALVGYSNSNIKDIKVTGRINGQTYIGGIAGTNHLTLTNCHFKGTVVGNGGLSGLNAGTIENSSFRGFVIGNVVGGIAGVNLGRIKSCFARAKLTGSLRIGGITGYSVSYLFNMIGEIYDSYFIGTISGGQYVGGLAGHYSRGGIIEDSFAIANLSASKYVGGLIGFSTNANIENSFVIADINGSEYTGELIGKASNSNITNCTYLNGSFNSTGDSINVTENSLAVNSMGYFLNFSNYPMNLWKKDTWDDHYNNKSFVTLSWEDAPYCGDGYCNADENCSCEDCKCSQDSCCNEGICEACEDDEDNINNPGSSGSSSSGGSNTGAGDIDLEELAKLDNQSIENLVNETTPSPENPEILPQNQINITEIDENESNEIKLILQIILSIIILCSVIIFIIVPFLRNLSHT